MCPRPRPTLAPALAPAPTAGGTIKCKDGAYMAAIDPAISISIALLNSASCLVRNTHTAVLPAVGVLTADMWDCCVCVCVCVNMLLGYCRRAAALAWM